MNCPYFYICDTFVRSLNCLQDYKMCERYTLKKEMDVCIDRKTPSLDSLVDTPERDGEDYE